MSAISSAEFSEIDINQKTIGLIATRLTAELDELHGARNTGEASVQVHLGAVHHVFLNSAYDFIKVSPVIAGGASGLRVRVTFDPMGYRRAADAAKDCMAGGTSGV